jgi:hypothetical protein
MVYRKVHRLSAPVVVIGYILLVPSVLCIASSALLLLGAQIFPSFVAPSQQWTASCAIKAEGAAFFGETYPSNPGAQPIAVAYCECIKRDPTDAALLAACKQKDRKIWSLLPGSCCAMTKTQKMELDTLMPSPATLKTYDEALREQPALVANAIAAARKETKDQSSGNMAHPQPEDWIGKPLPDPQTPWLRLVQLVGSGFAIAFGIASFVGGLLGWLLVMKKHVLQCPMCNVRVDAS